MNTAMPLESWTDEAQARPAGTPLSRSVVQWAGATADGFPSNPSGHEGISINVPSRSELLALVRSRLKNSNGFTLATLNLDHVVKLRAREDFRAAYRAQDFIVADGNPIVWLSRLAGRNIEVVPGADLVLPLMHLAAEMKAGVALVGSTPASLLSTSKRLHRLNPALNIAGCMAPSADFDPTGAEADEIIDYLAASEAKLCFLALGAPKQEVFAAYARKRLGSIGFISVGAGLDFISGTQKRAPRLLRWLALEWAWRLALNPGRLAGRYARCFAILPSLAREALRAKPDATASRESHLQPVSGPPPIYLSSPGAAPGFG